MPRILTPAIRRQIMQELRAIAQQLDSQPYEEFPVTDRDVRIALAAIIQDAGIQ